MLFSFTDIYYYKSHFSFNCMCVYAHVYVCAHACTHVYTCVHRGQRRSLYPLELGLQLVANSPTSSIGSGYQAQVPGKNSSAEPSL